MTREPLAPALLAPQDSYIQNRADTMQNIESTIVELGSIFQQLAHMVKEQEETIQRYKHPHPRQSPVRPSVPHLSVRPSPPASVPLPCPNSPRRIDASVEDAQLNVEAAHGEILKYFQSVTSNRWLMVKIFLILIVFFIVFVVFLA